MGKVAIEFRYPKGKPPCICIRFDSVYRAGKFNIGAVNYHGNELFDLVFFINDANLQLNILLTAPSKPYGYGNVRYNEGELYRFLYDTRDLKLFSFCHIANFEGRDVLPNTAMKKLPWVLKVKSVSIRREGREFDF